MGSHGHITWPSSSNPIWEFDYHLRGSAHDEGIAIEQAYYRGEKVFWKASMPMARVRYDGNTCGPYDDPVNYGTAERTNRSGSDKVATYSFHTGGMGAISVEAFYRIGNYRIVDRWTFYEDGQIYPRIWSGGLQCPTDHTHHAYWRMDFDIGGLADEMVFEYNSTTGNNGWGRGWTAFQQEQSRVKRPASNRSWAVMDRESGMGYHILPNPNSSPETPFAPNTLWAARYDHTETDHGRVRHRHSSDLAQYLDGEDIVAEDDLVWYCGHLDHAVHHHDEPGDGVDEWLHTGPRLVPFRYPG